MNWRSLCVKEIQMKKYDVTITEVLQHTETVEANSAREAEDMVREDYENCCIEVKMIEDVRFRTKPVREKESPER